jgi:hypothetical protein
MKLIRDKIANLRLLQFIFILFTSALLIFQITFPVLAITSYQSEPTEGPTQLLETQRRTDEISKSAPINPQDVSDATKGRGLNEVQGEADIDKMLRPENSQAATSVEQEVEGFLKKVTGKE